MYRLCVCSVVMFVHLFAGHLAQADCKHTKTLSVPAGGELKWFDANHDGSLVGLTTWENKGFVYGPKKFKDEGLIPLNDSREKHFKAMMINFLVAGDKYVTWGTSGKAHVWWPEKNQPEVKKALGGGSRYRKSKEGNLIFAWLHKRTGKKADGAPEALYRMVYVLNALTGERVAMGIHNGDVETGAISADGNWAFSVGEGFIMKWSTNKPGQGDLGVRWLKTSGYLMSLPEGSHDKTPAVDMASSATGDRVCVALADGRVVLVRFPEENGQQKTMATPLAGTGKLTEGMRNHALVFNGIDYLVVAKERVENGLPVQEIVQVPFRSNQPILLFSGGAKVVQLELSDNSVVALDEFGAFGFMSVGSSSHEWHWLDSIVKSDNPAWRFVISPDHSTFVVGCKHSVEIFKNSQKKELVGTTARVSQK